MWPSVSVIYVRIYQKLIPISYHKIRERMYWEESGKISKLKKQFSTSPTHHDSNNLLIIKPTRCTNFSNLFLE